MDLFYLGTEFSEFTELHNLYVCTVYILYAPIQVLKIFKKFQGNFCIVISAVWGALAFSSHKLITFFSPKTFFF